jgi:hypothetical protein
MEYYSNHQSDQISKLDSLFPPTNYLEVTTHFLEQNKLMSYHWQKLLQYMQI